MAKKKAPRTVLKCTRCRTTADPSLSAKAWNGWQVIPKKICPDCIAREMQTRQEAAEKHARKLQAAMALLEMQS